MHRVQYHQVLSYTVVDETLFTLITVSYLLHTVQYRSFNVTITRSSKN